MSKLADYSKFDHLTEDSSDDDDDDDDGKDTSISAAEETTPKRVTETAASAASLSQTATETGTATATATPAASHKSNSAQTQTSETKTRALGGVILRDETSGRYRFEYNGRTIYEFEQSLDEVTIYVLPPPYVTKGNQINCVISANHFKLGLVGRSNNTSGGNNKQTETQWFLNEATFGTVDVDESTWTLEDYDGADGEKTNGSKNGGARRKIIVVTLIKANRGTVWEAALKGNPNATTTHTQTNGNINTVTTTMDPLSKEQVKKELMLQRFGEENPGFDFSGADFNGSIPDAREFMGGIKYQ